MSIMTNPATQGMKAIAAKEAKQAFGQLLIDAQHEPIRIDRNGRPIAVVVSKAEFDRLSAIRQLMLEQARGGDTTQISEASLSPDPHSGSDLSLAGDASAAVGHVPEGPSIGPAPSEQSEG